MFFSRSESKQRVITKYSFRAALLTAVVAIAAGYYLHKQKVEPLQAAIPIPDYYGEAVKIDTEVIEKELPVDIRKNCRIARFGNAPVLNQGEEKDFTWDRGMRKALLRAGVPAHVIEQAIPRLRSGKHDGLMAMGNTHGTFNGQNFYPNHVTTFKANNRYGVCLDTQTIFSDITRKEYAEVYVIDGWYIGEYIICKNVSVFYLAPPSWKPYVAPPVVVPGLPDSYGALPPNVVPPPPGAYYVPPPIYYPPPGGYWNGWTPIPPVVHNVPEPETLYLFLGSLIALAFFRRKK